MLSGRSRVGQPGLPRGRLGYDLVGKPTAIESPPVNVYESNGQLTVAVPLPGAHHDTVDLNGRSLLVKAEGRYAQEQQHYLQHEWTVGTSHREVELPKSVRTAGAKAMLTLGILTVSLPIGSQENSERIRIPVTEPQVHQGQPH